MLDLLARVLSALGNSNHDMAKGFLDVAVRLMQVRRCTGRCVGRQVVAMGCRLLQQLRDRALALQNHPPGGTHNIQ